VVAEPSVAELYASSYRRLVGVVSLVAGGPGEAEECVQEAFVRLLERWPVVSRYDDPEAWVRLVAIRMLSNRTRQARNAVRAVRRHGTPGAAPAPNGDGLDVAAALRRLPVGQRQVLVLHHLIGLSVLEVADALQLPSGTVKSRLSRGRAALLPLLREEISHA